MQKLSQTMITYKVEDCEKGIETVPNLAPVSDSSAASTEYGDYAPLDCGTEVSVPSIVGDVTTTTDSDESCRHEPQERRVSFGHLDVRSYPIVLGDHPDCSVGPPLTIGWKPFKERRFEIDDYEEARPERRSKAELSVPWMERKKLLRRTSNISDEEIRAAMYDVHKTRKQRARTQKMTSFEFIELPLQSMRRKLKRAVSS